MDEFLEEEGKLGQGFTSTDLLEEIDIGDGDRPRPMFISANLDPKYKQELKSLLKEYKDCFVWEYFEMPGLDRSIVEHHLPIKPGYRPHQQGVRRCNPKILPDIKAEITRLIEANFIRSVVMPNGFLIWFLFTRRMANYECALISGISTKLRRWMVTLCR